MNEYVISCCSSADLSREWFEKLNVPVICFHIELDGVDYPDDMGRSISYEELFRRMQEGASTKTSQVGVGEYIDFFKGFLDEGKDVLHISLSSGISGTYNSACLARDELLKDYPGRKILVADSLAASSGYGLLVDTAAQKKQEGMGIDELYSYIEEKKRFLHHWFFSTDLTFYIRGGRISKTAGFFGKTLNICPLMDVDNEGRLIPREKIRGKKRVIERTFEIMRLHAENGRDYSKKCFICHSLCHDEARTLANLVEGYFHKMDGRVIIFPIGATIGCHTGPGTISLFFWGDERV